jgi:hypothetical protein
MAIVATPGQLSDSHAQEQLSTLEVAWRVTAPNGERRGRRICAGAALYPQNPRHESYRSPAGPGLLHRRGFD